MVVFVAARIGTCSLVVGWAWKEKKQKKEKEKEKKKKLAVSFFHPLLLPF